MKIEDVLQRREFIKSLGAAAGGVLLLPELSACSGNVSGPPVGPGRTLEVPRSVPSGWDPIAYNRDRGNGGAIPESYLNAINGPDGESKHLGKHLPFVVRVDGAPAGYVPLMWGDPSKGHARHPNAVPGPANNNEGHWYNWIRVRKATETDALEIENSFTGWPETAPGSTGRFLTLGGGDPLADDGKNTVYLTALPSDVVPGDTVRIWAHCLTHGEYVDFIEV